MFDLFDPGMITASVLGVPLLFVVIGIVTIFRKAGLEGRALLFASLGWGILIGAGYQLAVNDIPATFGGWFGVVIYGLAIGILAALFYDTLKGMLERSLSKLLETIEEIYLEKLGGNPPGGNN